MMRANKPGSAKSRTRAAKPDSMSVTPEAPKGPGRPRKELDTALLFELASIHCTDEEMSGVLGISVDTLKRRIADNEEVRRAYEGGKADGKASLRRLQWQAAKNGSAPILMWLGRNILDQSERKEVAITELPVLVISGPAAVHEDDTEGVIDSDDGGE